MIPIKATDILKSDYKILGEQYIKVQKEKEELQKNYNKLVGYIEDNIKMDEHSGVIVYMGDGDEENNELLAIIKENRHNTEDEQ